MGHAAPGRRSVADQPPDDGARRDVEFDGDRCRVHCGGGPGQPGAVSRRSGMVGRALVRAAADTTHPRSG